LLLLLVLALAHAVQAARPGSDGPKPIGLASPARTDRHGDPLPQGAVARLGTVRWRLTAYGTAVAFSPDSKTLATGDEKGTVQLWDTATGKELRRWKAHAGEVARVLFAPDARSLVTTSEEAPVRLWDVATGKPMREFRGNSRPATSAIAFTPDSKCLVTGWSDETVRLWDLASGKEICRFEKVAAKRVAVSPDGKLLAAGSNQDNIALCHIIEGRTFRCRVSPVDVAEPITALAFVNGGKALIVAAKGQNFGDSTAQLLDVVTGQEDRRFHFRSEIRVVSPDEKSLAGSSFSTVRWQGLAGKENSGVEKGHPGCVADMAFSLDGTRLAVVGRWRAVRLWDVISHNDARPTQECDHAVWCVAFSPDGSRLVTAGEDGTIASWDLRTGKTTWRHADPYLPSYCVAYSPDGSTVAAGRREVIDLLDATTGRSRRTIDGAETEMWSLAYSPDGRFLVAGEHLEPRLNDWNRAGRGLVMLASATGTPALVFPESRYDSGSWSVSSASFAPDGRSVLAVPWSWEGGGARLWCPVTGRVLRKLNGGGSTCCTAFLPHGRVVVTAGRDGRLTLCETATGLPRRCLSTGGSPIHAVAVSPDGRTAASGHDDGTVHL
jgi:WD40 repeat protein